MSIIFALFPFVMPLFAIHFDDFGLGGTHDTVDVFLVLFGCKWHGMVYHGSPAPFSSELILRWTSVFALVVGFLLYILLCSVC